MLGGPITALRTLTILPVPGRDAARLAAALPWFPLVGAGLGSALWGTALGVDRLARGWPEGAAAAAVVLGAFLTRGLHLDGLADWADGFGGGRDRESTLAIMKDPHVGSFGVVAVACVLVAKFAAMAWLVRCGAAAWIIAALVASRTAVASLAASHPYARADGGKSGGFIGPRPGHRAGALAAGLALIAAGFGLPGLAALGAAVVMELVFGRWCRRRVGGVTGDLLGACAELTETAVLFCAAAWAGYAAATGLKLPWPWGGAF